MQIIACTDADGMGRESGQILRECDIVDGFCYITETGVEFTVGDEVCVSCCGVIDPYGCVGWYC